MKFSILKGAVAALAVCSDVVLSQLTATQIVRNIEQLELISLDLKAPATFVDYLTQAQLITLGHSNFDVRSSSSWIFFFIYPHLDKVGL